jgi:hypothetical protein
VVRDGFLTVADIEKTRSCIRAQGLYRRNSYRGAGAVARARTHLRDRLKVTSDTRIVLCAGYADLRKGVDLFVEIGSSLMRRRSDTRFVWLGHEDTTLWPRIAAQLEASGLKDSFIFSGRDADRDLYFAGADVFALTSREDPFPSVVLESLDAGVPVVMFAGTGGCTELVATHCGAVVPAFDTAVFADSIDDLLRDPARAARLGRNGVQQIVERFSFRSYAIDLVSLLSVPIPRVSVVVPNYNYARFLRSRLDTIFRQTVPVYEIVVLDDASSDHSVPLLEELLETCGVQARLVVNEQNSGSVFRQWRRGAELCRGDLIWIAEADDLADAEFLEATVAAFCDPQVVLSYCQSRQMAMDGSILCDHYRIYTSDISPDKWLNPYVAEGLDEIRTALAVKNTIPNVSAVVFRRDALIAALTECEERLSELRVAGDWLVYVTMLTAGRIAFTPRALNSHRRHADSVTVSNFNLTQLGEITAMQQEIRQRFPLDEAVRRRAGAYAQQLYEEFGLRSEEQPHVDRHPLLAPAFSD